MMHDVTLTMTARISAELNNKHREVQRLGRTAKELAAEIGDMLIEVKRELAHGQFGKWCEDNLSFNHATRARYIKTAQARISQREKFDACSSIAEVLDLGKPKAEPEPERRAATPDDLRKVARLRALRDDPAASAGEKFNAQAKLDEIEKEVDLEAGNHTACKSEKIRNAAARATAIILSRDLSGNAFARALLEEALIGTYGKSEVRIGNILSMLESSL